MKNLYKLVSIILCFVILSGCVPFTKEPITKTGFYFDTVIDITIYDNQDMNLLDTCFDYCEDFENLISRTIPTSDISKINTSNGNPVVVSDTTIELLKLGIKYGDLTDGVFDVTIAPLAELWDFKNNPGTLPSESAITEATAHVNYKNIRIDGNMVTLIDPDAAIDLGGIAKGYMADRLKEYLMGQGVESALINLGGNVLTIGVKPDKTAFNIGIQKPFDENNSTISSVSIKDSSIVTSGTYERYFKLDDKIYHHILDTTTGYPCDNDLLSVTILSKDSVDGDALSTSCFALGLEKGVELLQTLDNVDAIFIRSDYEIVDTREL